jgi:predicted transposase YbfD/YdcC
MSEMQSKLSLVDHFTDIKDPRREHCKLHLLQDILTIALCAVICGADTWHQIELFGLAKQAWLSRFLQLPNGIPSHDTFRRVFCALKPGAFEDCFVSWMNAACSATGLQRIHIDGKTLRGSRRKTKDGLSPALHLVSAWAGANHLTLGQVAVDDKSNEITAIPKLLELLDLTGCIVTIDAIGTQKAIAEQIVDAGGDYVLAVKENQPTLFADIGTLLSKALDSDFAGLDYDLFQSEEKGHGRSETRTYLAIHEPAGLSTLADWKGLKTVIVVTRERQEGSNSSTEQHYYISSAALRQRAWEEVIRGHWGIENSLHWVLDVVFKEDACRTLDENAACNLALLRKIALCLLKRMPGKESMPDKRLHAGWDEAYLEKILGVLCVKGDQLPSSPSQRPAPRLHAASPD